MRSFKEFGIKSKIKSFEGDKIKIERIINKVITVEDFKISESKFKEKGSGDVLTIQLMVDNTKRVLFTGSTNLMGMIREVPKEEFPFTTTIIRENERFEFS